MIMAGTHEKSIFYRRKLTDYFALIFSKLAFWRKKPPLYTLTDVQDFTFQQSAFIAQTTLFGYLRTRAGLQHFTLFADDTFIALLKPARTRILLACAADLSIYSAAHIGAPHFTDYAEKLFAYCLDKTAHAADLNAQELDEIKTRFEKRLAITDWDICKTGETAFSQSPHALLEHAPIIDRVKHYDTTIVVNSMRFKWQAVRAEFNARINYEMRP